VLAVPDSVDVDRGLKQESEVPGARTYGGGDVCDADLEEVVAMLDEFLADIVATQGSWSSRRV
jgi:NifB/MoaA-like Fe-S oxidoreductase